MQYELLYIVPATHAENELKPVLDGIAKEIEKAGASIVRSDMVGKHKLSYPIGQVRHGYYVLSDIELDGGNVTALGNSLRLHADVIRHQVVVKNAKAKPVTRISSFDEVEREKAAARAGKPRSSAPRPRTRVEKGKKVEINMEEVEKKLDKILEGKIL
jgi:small subunit ribosomal protein S6